MRGSIGGRRLMLVALPLAIALTAVVLSHASKRWRASAMAAEVFESSVKAAATGRPARGVMLKNLEQLSKAEALDPTNVTVPLMRGSQHLLLRDPHAALRAYNEALALEPRSEIYLNIGRAHRMAGDEDAAANAFDKAIVLDRSLRRDLESFFERRRRSAKEDEQE